MHDKPYLLIAYDQHSPKGGCNDFQGVYEYFIDAMAAFDTDRWNAGVILDMSNPPAYKTIFINEVTGGVETSVDWFNDFKDEDEDAS